MKAFLTVIGKDKPGIIAGVSRMLADKNINIEDISQTVLQGNFTMIMLVNLEGSGVSLMALSDDCAALGRDIGVTIHLQQKDIFDAMHEI